MSDHPIIFSGPMLRALLDGRKTQTRRVLKPQPVAGVVAGLANGEWAWASEATGHVCGMVRLRYATGDRLWVREAWTQDGCSDGAVAYRCSDDVPGYIQAVRWRPSIRMPRWASRITLTVTDVRVQRLQDITEADAKAEGGQDSGESWQEGPPRASARYNFQNIWSTIHGPDAWDANPWVAAYTFTVARRNIDSMGGADD